MWRNEYVTLGDFMDFLEWRRIRRGIPAVQLDAEPVNKGKPLLRVYCNGVNLYAVSQKGKFFRLREKLHQGKPLNRVPGVTPTKETITISFTINHVLLQYCESGMSQSVYIPKDEICSIYNRLITERERVTGIYKGKLISKK